VAGKVTVGLAESHNGLQLGLQSLWPHCKEYVNHTNVRKNILISAVGYKNSRATNAHHWHENCHWLHTTDQAVTHFIDNNQVVGIHQNIRALWLKETLFEVFTHLTIRHQHNDKLA